VLFLRALLAFLAMPGVVAIAVPVAWLVRAGRTEIARPWALALLAAGFAGLLWCVRDFFVAGRGTLAPWSPPRRLVTIGLYRWSRNPMYLAVLVMLAGWGLAFDSDGHLAYAAVMAVLFHLRVVGFEEPWIARTFAHEWEAYRRRVPRWLGRVGPSSAS
jgi:protein-S-isoprenylcysteine O-methyltransferase Ste14